MSKNKKNFFILTRILSDLALIPGIFIFAYIIKFKIGWIAQNILAIPFGKIYGHAQVEPYLKVLPFVIALWLNSFYLSGMYRKFTGLMPLMDELVAIIKGVSIATIQVIVFSFIYKSFPGSRFVIFYAWLLGIIIIFITRILIHWIELYFLKIGVGQTRALVIGAEDLGQDVVEKMIVYPTLRLYYVGTIDSEKPDKIHYHLRDNFKLLGNTEKLFQILEKEKIGIIFITKNNLSNQQLIKLVKHCNKNHIELKILSEIAAVSGGNMEIEELDGIPFMSFKLFTPHTLEIFLKRFIDIIISLFVILYVLPVFILTSLLIKLVSPQGSIFYTQTRVGKNNHEFKMIKFRTMIPDAEKHSGPVMVKENNENRYIKFGRFLRRLSIDELPQLFNVLKGDMSLVGPRPERPHFVNIFAKEIPFYNLRHQVPVGITGWAQVNGRSYLTNNPAHKVKYDLYYIKNWSLILDFKILIKTLFVVFTKEEAY